MLSNLLNHLPNRKRDAILSTVTDRLLAAEREIAVLNAAAERANGMREDKASKPFPDGQYI